MYQYFKSKALFLHYSHIPCYQPYGDKDFVGAAQNSEIIT